jgi:hypothetical protein
MTNDDRTEDLNNNDPRFDQLMDLAREGNEEAIADLFLEYEHCYYAAPIKLDDDQFPAVSRTDWRFHEHLVLAMEGDFRAIQILKDEFLYDYRMEQAGRMLDEHKALQAVGGAV